MRTQIDIDANSETASYRINRYMIRISKVERNVLCLPFGGVRVRVNMAGFTT